MVIQVADDDATDVSVVFHVQEALDELDWGRVVQGQGGGLGGGCARGVGNHRMDQGILVIRRGGQVVVRAGTEGCGDPVGEPFHVPGSIGQDGKGDGVTYDRQ